MNLKVKITIIILVTLIVGIFLGILINRIYIQYQIKKLLSWREPNHFIYLLENTLKPNEEQARQLRAILEKHADEMEKMRNEFSDKMIKSAESLRDEIIPLLTPEQRKILEDLPKPLQMPGFFPGPPPGFKKPPKGPWRKGNPI